MAKIQLNGKKINISSKLTVFDVLKKYKINEKKVAIELNGKILPKNNLKKKMIKNLDKIEIVQFIGGG
jgi:thiamine biosynthesis protein ThiS|tara:strand:- start:70 stop:273 length:204 start_codon:yes stop_codon:yes gene_type:complete